MSVKSVCWPLWAVLLGTLAVWLPGCGRYDSYERNMERNMRYVSGEVLVSESVVAYDRLRAAHDAWRASSRPEALDTFRDMYSQYEVIFNELMDRAGGRPTNHLPKFAATMPPPPPGVAIKGLPTTPLPPPVSQVGGEDGPSLDRTRAAKATKTAIPATAPPDLTPGPPGEDSPDAEATPDKAASPQPSAKPDKAKPARGASDDSEAPAAKSGKPKAAATMPDGLAANGAYVLRPGDTLHLLAKRFRVSEARLLEVNAISDPQRLTVGRQILIPTNE